MTDIGNEAADKPLDPATERLRRKMVRLLVLSVSTLFIGVMAVLGAIVYKLNRDAPPTEAVDLSIALPAGSALLDISAAGDTAFLRIAPEAGGPQSLLRVDLGSGRVLARYALEGLAPAPAAVPAAQTSPAAPARPPATTGAGTPAPMLDLYKTP